MRLQMSLWLAALLVAGLLPAMAHDAHGRSNAPAEARRLKNPVAVASPEVLASAQGHYSKLPIARTT
jgi:hypothetical protein